MDILNVDTAKINLKIKLSSVFRAMEKTVSKKTDDLTVQISLLRELRSDIYEQLNQLQHEYLIIKSSEQFAKQYPDVDTWRWHPNQTSGKGEPDLIGYCKGKVVISAEITTSQKPIGSISTRMKKVMKKLEECEGDKFYVVETEEMKNSADRKVNSGDINNVVPIIVL